MIVKHSSEFISNINLNIMYSWLILYITILTLTVLIKVQCRPSEA